MSFHRDRLLRLRSLRHLDFGHADQDTLRYQVYHAMPCSCY